MIPTQIIKKSDVVLIDYKPPVLPRPVIIKAADVDEKKLKHGILARTTIDHPELSY